MVVKREWTVSQSLMIESGIDRKNIICDARRDKCPAAGTRELFLQPDHGYILEEEILTVAHF